ncbi:MAG: Crp/Fnr family transcriptional regulator [Nitrospiraceae bacterium]|nr:MAG: Crp/Fnr family transcriptional regulator [Nitrospiraceae bacterium]
MNEKKPDRLTLLKNTPLFLKLPESALRMLDGILIERSFLKGENIFTEGSESDGFYIIIKGRVKVFKLSAEGKEQILHIVGAKELLGAVSAFAGTPYPAHADAMEKTTAFFLPGKDFLVLIQKEPSVVMNMMANLSMRLQHFTRMIEDLSLKEVPGRLAAYLLYLHERTGRGDVVEIDISKGQLASLLGTIPETLSRILRKMSEKGLLKVSGRKVRLLNRKVLHDIVNGEKAGL